MGWNGFDEGDVIDLTGTSMDAGTMGDIPMNDTGPIDASFGGISSAISNLGYNPGYTPAMGMVGGGVMAAGRALTGIVASAIVKISQRLGGASGSVAGYGRKVWASLSGWAAKNPGVSLMSTLVSLGLTVEEAAHFIAWGATSKRKRRSRGISGRDLKTTRRTIRKLNSMQHTLSQLCRTAVHHRRRVGHK